MIHPHQPTHTVLADSLKPGEQLLWSGRPRQIGLARFGDTPFGVIGGILILVIILPFWFSSPAPSTGIGEQPVSYLDNLLILFVLMSTAGFLLMIPVLKEMLIWYGITDQRIIVITSFFRIRERSLPLSSLASVSVDLNADGTLLFNPKTRTAPKLTFSNLENPTAPHQLILDRMLR